MNPFDKRKLMEADNEDKRQTKSAIAESYIRLHPDMPNMTIARMLCNLEPENFYSIEQARSAVRGVRGVVGAHAKRYMPPKKDMIRTDEEIKQARINPMGIPPTDSKKWIPYVFPIKKGKGLAIFDLHVPYHDPYTIQTAIEYARKHGHLDFIILGGDIQDYYTCSKFLTDPKRRDVAGEIRMTKQVLLAFSMLKEKPFIIFKSGNHDDRLLLYQRRRCPELCGIDTFNIENLLQLKKLDIQYVGDSRPIQFGNLDILHGHELSRGNLSPVNFARTVFLKAKRSALAGHAHTSSNHKGKDSRGKIISCWSAPCACELTPEYARLNEWSSGFVLLEKDGDAFSVDVQQIVDGKVYHA